MKEIWKDIKNYEGLYQISNLGRVKSFYKNGKILKPNCSDGRYLKIVLCKNKTKRTFFIHRLVAEAFIPNPNNLPEVNHIDFNKKNNCVKNLEWVTSKENMHHLFNTEIHKVGMLKSIETRYNNYIKPYEEDIIRYYTVENKTIKEISSLVGLYTSTISNCLRKNNIPILRANVSGEYFRKNNCKINYKIQRLDENKQIVATYNNYSDIVDFIRKTTGTEAKRKSIVHDISIFSDTERKVYGYYWRKINNIKEEK